MLHSYLLSKCGLLYAPIFCLVRYTPLSDCCQHVSYTLLCRLFSTDELHTTFLTVVYRWVTHWYTYFFPDYCPQVSYTQLSWQLSTGRLHTAFLTVVHRWATHCFPNCCPLESYILLFWLLSTGELQVHTTSSTVTHRWATHSFPKYGLQMTYTQLFYLLYIGELQQLPWFIHNITKPNWLDLCMILQCPTPPCFTSNQVKPTVLYFSLESVTGRSRFLHMMGNLLY